MEFDFSVLSLQCLGTGTSALTAGDRQLGRTCYIAKITCTEINLHLVKICLYRMLMMLSVSDTGMLINST